MLANKAKLDELKAKSDELIRSRLQLLDEEEVQLLRRYFGGDRSALRELKIVQRCALHLQRCLDGAL